MVIQWCDDEQKLSESLVNMRYTLNLQENFSKQNDASLCSKNSPIVGIDKSEMVDKGSENGDADPLRSMGRAEEGERSIHDLVSTWAQI
jgi:hypothetical protein